MKAAALTAAVVVTACGGTAEHLGRKAVKEGVFAQAVNTVQVRIPLCAKGRTVPPGRGRLRRYPLGQVRCLHVDDVKVTP